MRELTFWAVLTLQGGVTLVNVDFWYVPSHYDYSNLTVVWVPFLNNTLCQLDTKYSVSGKLSFPLTRKQLKTKR